MLKHANRSKYCDKGWQSTCRLIRVWTLLQAGFAGVYVCRVENTLEPTNGPKKLTTHSKRTVVYIVGKYLENSINP